MHRYHRASLSNDKNSQAAVRAQVASVMKRASTIVGNDAGLARRLEVDARTLQAWLAGNADCPVDRLNVAVEIIFDSKPGKP